MLWSNCNQKHDNNNVACYARLARLNLASKFGTHPCLLRLRPVRLNDMGMTSDPAVAADDVAGYFEPEEWEAAKHDDISLQEVRRALSLIPGSLADAVITSREER